MANLPNLSELASGALMLKLNEVFGHIVYAERVGTPIFPNFFVKSLSSSITQKTLNTVEIREFLNVQYTHAANLQNVRSLNTINRDVGFKFNLEVDKKTFGFKDLTLSFNDRRAEYVEGMVQCFCSVSLLLREEHAHELMKELQQQLKLINRR